MRQIVNTSLAYEKESRFKNLHKFRTHRRISVCVCVYACVSYTNEHFKISIRYLINLNVVYFIIRAGDSLSVKSLVFVIVTVKSQPCLVFYNRDYCLVFYERYKANLTILIIVTISLPYNLSILLLLFLLLFIHL